MVEPGAGKSHFQALDGSLLRFKVVFIFLVIRRHDVREHGHYFPRQLDSNLLSFRGQLVYGLAVGQLWSL